MLGFDLLEDIGLERFAADANAAGSPEHIENPRALTSAVAAPMHQVRGFVSAFVADHAEERHG